MEPGEQVHLIGSGHCYLAELGASDPKKGLLNGTVLSFFPVPKSDWNLELWIGLPKGHKMDQIIDQAVQAGVTRIRPFYSRFGDVREKDSESRFERWRKITLAAAQQSLRWSVPEIEKPESLSRLIEADSTDAFTVLFYEHASEWLPDRECLSSAGTIRCIIGPEGGFSEEEVEMCINRGFSISLLSPWRLRTETAAVTSCALLTFFKQYSRDHG